MLRVAFLSSTALELLGTLSVGLVAVGAGVRLVEGTMALYPALVAILLAGEAHRPVREAGARFHDTARATAVLDERDAVLASSPSASEGRRSSGRCRRVVRAWPCGTWRSGTRGGASASPRLAALDAAGGELLVVAGPSGVGQDDAAARARRHARRRRLGRGPGRGARAARRARPAPAAPARRDGGRGAGRRRHRPCCGACGLDLDPAAPLAEAGRSLSSGQRRRLALARVLGEAAADPAGTVVLLDEPTAHLDAASEQAVVAELRALAGAGALVLAVAHRDALRHAADRVVDLRLGRCCSERAVRCF